MNKRLVALGGAMIALWIALVSPVAHLDHHLLTAHMVQHLLLMVMAAPLILLAPGSIMFWGLRLPVALCWLSGTLTVIFWHVPTVFVLGVRSHYWHGIEQISFLAAGVLFWHPVIKPLALGVSPEWSIPVYLFLATLPCDILSAYLAFCGHIVYPWYASGDRMLRLSPLDDQALAGALMWVVVTFAYLVPAIVLSERLLAGEQNHSAGVV